MIHNDEGIKTRVFPEKNYKAFYIGTRTVRVALDPSKPILPLDFPEFYDVKITDFCLGKCPYCYMDSLETGRHADNIVEKVYDFFGPMSENERPLQVAIGGGEPTSHPDFIELLEAFYNLGITPNYTTNGMFVDQDNCCDILDATSMFSGGVAVSAHPHIDWEGAVDILFKEDVKLNTHHIISDIESIDKFLEIFEEQKHRVDHFVLLPYGVQGRAVHKDIDWEYLVESAPADTNQFAFGANFHPYLRDTKNPFSVSIYEPESMSRFLDLKDMKLYPSSFHMA